jgi:hypothetical protein
MMPLPYESGVAPARQGEAGLADLGATLGAVNEQLAALQRLLASAPPAGSDALAPLSIAPRPPEIQEESGVELKREYQFTPLAVRTQLTLPPSEESLVEVRMEREGRTLLRLPALEAQKSATEYTIGEYLFSTTGQNWHVGGQQIIALPQIVIPEGAVLFVSATNGSLGNTIWLFQR